MRFFDSTLVIFVTQITGLGAVFLCNLVISRVYGSEGKGIITALLYIPSILFSLSNLGMGFTAQYFVGRGDGDVRHHYANLLIFPMIVAAFFVAAFIATFQIWQPYLGSLTLPQVAPCFVILMLLVIYEPTCQFLIALDKVRQRAYAVLTQSFVSLVMVILFTFALKIVSTQIIWGYILGWGAAAIVGILLVYSAIGAPKLPSLTLFKKTFRYGFWIYLATLITQLAMRADFFFVFAVLGKEQGGVYSVATGLTTPLYLIPQAAQSIFFPKTSGQTDQEARVSTPFYYRQILLAMTAVMAFVAVLAKPVLWMFGDQFSGAFAPMLILLIATTIKGMSGILSLHILGRGKAYVMTLSTAVTLVAAIGFNYFLVPRLGTVGAAISTTVAYGIENILLLFLYRKLVGGSISDLYAVSRTDFAAAFNAGSDLIKRARARIS